jgi:signal transduction histidine kinase
VQRQAQREHILNQLNQALTPSDDPEQILQKIVSLVGESFGVDRVMIFKLDTEIRLLSEWRAHDQIKSIAGFRAPLSEWPDLLDPKSDFNQRRALHVLDYSSLSQTETRKRQIEEEQTRSVLSIPIFMHDRLFGSLALHTTTCYRTFTTEEIQFLFRIADQAVIALYNAQNYDDLEQLVQQRTQELEQEKQISEAANRAKTEFLATMSHELRTPLNAILGLSQILKRQIFGDLTSKQVEYIDHIHSSGEHLLMLINDILDLAKVESGRDTLTPTMLDVSEICTYCLTLVQEQASEHTLQLMNQIDPEAKYCIADERRLKQMLLNLLSNAIKFTPAGSVSLIVQKEPGGISFTVNDTGIGIPSEKLSLLFQPFSQLDSQLSRRYAGTGLGLALTRKLAHLHGGEVTVQSVPGEGSQFSIYLPDQWAESTYPLSCDLREHPQYPISTPTVGKILIVEDDLCSATLLQDYLRNLGYGVEYLSDGTDFLDCVRRFNPNLIFLDVQLSTDLTGLDLLRELRQQPDLENLPVVVLTAMAMSGDRERFLAAGATNYLSKPLDIVQLELVLTQHF